MGLLDKVKNFFYDEEEDENFESNIETNNIKEDIKNDLDDSISERDLFRAERTFNFPMDLEDTVYEKKVVKINAENKKDEENKKEIKINSYKKKEYNSDNTTDIKEKPKFKPTPIISPIYGVLDKNYKKEDFALDNIMETNVTRKLDYDDVMKKAYGQVNSNDAEEDNKGIFYNLEENKNSDMNNDEEVKIIYNDVSYEENLDNNINESKYDDKALIDEDNILSETKEQDLFNLIDDMYSSDEEDE